MFLIVASMLTHSVRSADVWPDAKFTALGAFIFLRCVPTNPSSANFSTDAWHRFISPALVSPETIDIELPSENVAIRRGLLIITKIIQNLANNVRFGKEVHMMCFNDFLQSNIIRVMRFLTDVNVSSKLYPYPYPWSGAHDLHPQKPSASSADDPDEWQCGEFDETNAIVLHRFFEKHADKVGKELLSLSKSSKEGEAAVIGGKKAWDTLCAALVEMGQPLDVPRLTPETSASYDLYREFMARHADRSTDAVSSMFTEVATKEDSIVYLLPMSQIDAEVLDYELFSLHVFKVSARTRVSPLLLMLMLLGRRWRRTMSTTLNSSLTARITWPHRRSPSNGANSSSTSRPATFALVSRSRMSSIAT